MSTAASCSLAGSVPLSSVPTSALLAPLSVHGVVLFALPGAVVHVDAAEYVAFLQQRLAALSDNERRSALAAACVPDTTPPAPRASADGSPTRARPPRAERLSFADASPPRLGERRRPSLFRRVFDRYPEPTPTPDAPRPSSVDNLGRRISTSAASTASTGSTATATEGFPPASGVLVRPRATRPRGSPRPLPRPPAAPLERCCDSPQSMSASDLDLASPRRSLSDAGAKRLNLRSLASSHSAGETRPADVARRRSSRPPAAGFGVELPTTISSASGSDFDPVDRRRVSIGTPRRSLSVGARSSTEPHVVKAPEDADAMLARRASTVGFIPIGSAGAFEPVAHVITDTDQPPAAGKLGRLNAIMGNSLRRGKKKESTHRASDGMFNGPGLSRTQSTGNIRPGTRRVSVSRRSAFRSTSRHGSLVEDAQGPTSRVRRMASRLGIK